MTMALVVTFFVLNGQCWVTDGRQALNLANAFTIESHSDNVHVYGSSYTGVINMPLAAFLARMREACGTPQKGSTP